MSDSEKLIEIAGALLARTKAREPLWSETAKENEFVTSLESFTVKIVSEYPEPSHRLAIVNQNGRPIALLRTDQRSSTDNAILRDLYSLARRQALKIDESLDSILAQVKRQAN